MIKSTNYLNFRLELLAKTLRQENPAMRADTALVKAQDMIESGKVCLLRK